MNRSRFSSKHVIIRPRSKVFYISYCAGYGLMPKRLRLPCEDIKNVFCNHLSSLAYRGLQGCTLSLSVQRFSFSCSFWSCHMIQNITEPAPSPPRFISLSSRDELFPLYSPCIGSGLCSIHQFCQKLLI